MAYKYLTIAIALSCALAASVCAQDSTSNIPGAQSAAGILASSANGVAQYFDQNGPIQPAVVALGTLPARGAEQLNKALSQLSSGLYGQAQRLSQSAGQNGQIQMPGLQRAASQMPESLTRISQRMQNGIRRKNEWIMSRAQDGVDSTNRLGERMRSSVNSQGDGSSGDISVRASGTLSSAVESGENMLGNARNSLMDGASQFGNRAQQQLNGLRGQMAPAVNFGQDLAGQLGEYSRTIASGLQGAVGELQQTGQQLMNQMQNNHPRNMQTMSQLMNSMQGSLRSNLGSLARQAQNMGQSAIERARGLSRNGLQRAQDANGRAQDLGRNAIKQAENLGQNAANQAQNLGQSAAKRAQDAAQQAQAFGQSAAQQAQAFGQSAAQQAQNLGQSTLQQADNLSRGALNQAQNAAQQAQTASQSAAQQLSDGIRNLVPSGLVN